MNLNSIIEQYEATVYGLDIDNGMIAWIDTHDTIQDTPETHTTHDTQLEPVIK